MGNQNKRDGRLTLEQSTLALLAARGITPFIVYSDTATGGEECLCTSLKFAANVFSKPSVATINKKAAHIAKSKAIPAKAQTIFEPHSRFWERL